MTKTPEFVMIQGRAFKRVDTMATGHWQILQMKSIGCYILVNPAGRQAWFTEAAMNEVVAKLGSSFRYSNNPLRDLNKLAKHGLRPFHVDDDFSPDGLDTASSVH